MLAVLDAGHDLPLGRGVAFQLVGDQHTRRSSLLLQQFAQQAFGCLLVAPALDQDIENRARLVDRAPEPVLLAGDADDDLIEVPFVATARRTPLDAVGKLPAEPSGSIAGSSHTSPRCHAPPAPPRPSAGSVGTENTARPHS